MKVLATTFALALPAISFAIPAKRTPFQATQPDGSVITLKATGDERCHRLYTEDNLPVIYQEGVGYVYATIDEAGMPAPSKMQVSDIRMRTSAEKDFITKINLSSINEAYSTLQKRNETVRPRRLPQEGTGLCETTVPAKGKQKHVAILVEFKDTKFSIEDPHDFFTRQLNEEGFSDYGSTGSVRDYFMLNSCGQFDPEFLVYGPVTVSKNYRQYGANDAWGYDKNPHEMIIEACKLIEDFADFREFDNDGDGIVDSVYVIYAGFGEADYTENANLIWPHSFDLSQATSEECRLDGVVIDHYTCSNELNYMGRNYTGLFPAGIGTFVHEFSHAMGLPDLYCTSNDNTPYTPGAFEVLDYGPYNNEGRTPPNYSAYERFALGWMTPDIMTESGTYTLNPIQDDNKAILIPTTDPNEYMLLENRQLKDNDLYLPGHGMLVWRVLYDKKTWDNNTVNNDARKQGVDLIEADNIFTDATQSGDPFPGTKRVTKFGYNTTPALKSFYGDKMFVEISDIKEAGGVISFYAEIDGSGIKLPSAITSSESIYAQNGSIFSNDEDTLPVYDSLGRLVGHVTSGTPFTPSMSGIYIVARPSSPVKISI